MYSTGTYIQYPVTHHNGKNIYVTKECIYVTLCSTAEIGTML